MPPSLPRALGLARSSPADYVYDYGLVAPLALVRDVPLRDKPSLAWLALVAVQALAILRNRLAWIASHARPDGGGPMTVDLPSLGVSGLDLRALPGSDEGREALARDVVQELLPPPPDALLDAGAPKPAQIAGLVRALLERDIRGPFDVLAEVMKAAKDGPTGRPGSLDDYRSFLETLPAPWVADVWERDEVFAWMRVAGFNPLVLRRAALPDARFPVTEDHYAAAMGDPGDSLARASAEGRLYLCDYAALAGAEGSDFPVGRKYPHAPLALFALPRGAGARRLRPVAIQCGQDPSAHPVFTPADGEAWREAKAVVGSADMAHHELVGHLGRTHLLVEPFVIAARRHLDDHWLGALLSPHFEGTLHVNDSAQSSLIAPGHQVDMAMAPAIQSSRAVAAASVTAAPFDDAALPRDLALRDVGSPELEYPYRDDALLVWGAVERWVTAYVNAFVSSDDEVAKDPAIARWAAEVAAEDGGRLPSFGEGAPGRVATVGYLTRAVTTLVFTASAQHAAVNFPQAGLMTFVPPAPGALYRPAPASKEVADEHPLLDLMPPLEMGILQVEFLTLLGGVNHTRLGHYLPGALSPRVAGALREFRAELERVTAVVADRNASRLGPYPYLSPDRIPQSINI